MVAFACLLPIGLHRRYIVEDTVLPFEDVPGHLALLMRWYDVFFYASAPPPDPYPPGLYLVASVCMRALGACLPSAEWAVVVFAAALSSAMAVLGLRLQGRTAGVLLPLLVCAAPAVTNYSRLFLLDLPATATLAWVGVAVASCDGFRRTLPTLGLGVALAATLLTKYPFLVWAPVLVLAPFLLMIRRDPASLLPLFAFSAPIVYVARRLAEGLDGKVVELRTSLGALAAVSFVGAVVWGVYARRGDRRFLPGIRLGMAASGALALVAPWVALAAARVEDNVLFNVVEKSRPETRTNLTFAWFDLQQAWPYTEKALLFGGILALAELGARTLFPRGRLLGADQERAPVLVVLLVAAAAAAGGAWATANTLMPNTRYYLPLYPIAAVVIGLPVARLALTRWALTPVIALACGLQLVATAGLWEPPSKTFEVRVDRPLPRPRDPGLLFVPSDVYTAGPRRAVERGLSALARELSDPGCGVIALRRAPGGDARAIPALGALHGFRECMWIPAGTRAAPKAWVFVGLRNWDVERAAPATAGWRVLHEEPLPDQTVVSVRAR